VGWGCDRRVRLWGSIAFMVASTLVGQAASSYGNHVILWALAGTAAFTAVAAMLQPPMPAATKPESSNKYVPPDPLFKFRNSAQLAASISHLALIGPN
jgi:hypothetical protein